MVSFGEPVINRPNGFFSSGRSSGGRINVCVGVFDFFIFLRLLSRTEKKWSDLILSSDSERVFSFFCYFHEVGNC